MFCEGGRWSAERGEEGWAHGGGWRGSVAGPRGEGLAGGGPSASCSVWPHVGPPTGLPGVSPCCPRFVGRGCIWRQRPCSRDPFLEDPSPACGLLMSCLGAVLTSPGHPPGHAGPASQHQGLLAWAQPEGVGERGWRHCTAWGPAALVSGGAGSRPGLLVGGHSEVSVERFIKDSGGTRGRPP